MSGFLILILILGALWVLFALPARRRRQAHVAMQDSIDIGDEIITAGGLHGHVREIGDDQLELEIAEGVVVTLDRRAVAAVARDVDVEQDEAEDAMEPEPQDEDVSGAEEPAEPR
jgi:preprotein translocase subunit YajC